MLELALTKAQKAGTTNVEFLKGTIEAIPLPANRALTPGGRTGVADVVADDALSPAQRAERGDYVGCIAGALSFTEYREGL